MKKLLLVLILLLLPLPVAARTIDPHLKWRTFQTDHFHLHFYEEERGIASNVAPLLEKTYTRLSETLKWRPAARTHVVLYDHLDLTNGMATPLPYNTMILFIKPPHEVLELETYDDWLTELVTHEFTHILHLDQAGGLPKVLRYVFGRFPLFFPNLLTPNWNTEGLAVLSETEETTGGRNRSSYSEMLIRTDILQGQFLPISKAGGEGIDWPGGQAPYLYGGKFWQYLKGTYGEEKIQAWIAEQSRHLWPFSINRRAKKVWGKTFPKLWKEWELQLQKRYGDLKERLTAEGLSSTTVLVTRDKESLTSPVFLPRSEDLLYLRSHTGGRKEVRVFSSTKDELLFKVPRKAYLTSPVSPNPEGDLLAFSMIGNVALGEKNYYYSDLYLFDRKRKKIQRLTRDARAFDPSFAPDGDGQEILFVHSHLLSNELKKINWRTGKISTLYRFEEGAQIANPQFSPDGGKILFSIREPDQKRQIALLDLAKGSYEKVGLSGCDNLSPFWSSEGDRFYFAADPDGIFNIYRTDVLDKKTTRESRLLTGAFHPAVSGKGRLIAQYYHGKGFDLREIIGSPQGLGVLTEHLENTPKEIGQRELASPTIPSVPLKETSYQPWRTIFLPRFWLPLIETQPGGATILGAMTINRDPLFRHQWVADGYWRSDAGRGGFDLEYQYSRYEPTLLVEGHRRFSNFGDILSKDAAGLIPLGQDYLESRLSGFVGLAWRPPSQRFEVGYFHEDRTNITTIPTTQPTLPARGRIGGIRAGWTFSNGEEYPASISPERGRMISLNVDLADRILGGTSHLEQKFLWGEWREYLPIPLWRRHVFALRFVGGRLFQDEPFQGIFAMGGAGSGTNRFNDLSFPLRGVPPFFLRGSRLALASAEYRLPVISPQKGWGTYPLFVQNLHMALFADYGDAWNEGEKRRFFDNFLLGTGLEFRTDFIVAYGFPITLRVGYGIIVTNRQRLEGRTDPSSGGPLKEGLVLIEATQSF